MTVLEMHNAGMVGGWSGHITELTDEALQEQIQALDLVCAYLTGRGDCGLLLRPLTEELQECRSVSKTRSEV